MSTLSRQRFLGQMCSADRADLEEEFVISNLSWESNPTARWFLIKAVGMLKIATAVPQLVQICREPDIELDETSLHAICAWTLGRIGDPATNELIRLLSCADAETRRCAADALGEIRSTAAIPMLASLLMNDERQVQLWAGLALAKIGIRSVPFLEKAIMQSDETVRLIAIDALDKIGRIGL